MTNLHTVVEFLTYSAIDGEKEETTQALLETLMDMALEDNTDEEMLKVRHLAKHLSGLNFNTPDYDPTFGSELLDEETIEGVKNLDKWLPTKKVKGWKKNLKELIKDETYIEGDSEFELSTKLLQLL